jgi:hypothetical protein
MFPQFRRNLGRILTCTVVYRNLTKVISILHPPTSCTAGTLPKSYCNSLCFCFPESLQQVFLLPVYWYTLVRRRQPQISNIFFLVRKMRYPFFQWSSKVSWFCPFKHLFCAIVAHQVPPHFLCRGYFCCKLCKFKIVLTGKLHRNPPPSIHLPHIL